MVSKEKLAKFKQLYLKKYNVSLTDEEATEMATALVNLMSILLKPDSEEVQNTSEQEERRTDETLTAHTP